MKNVFSISRSIVIVLACMLCFVGVGHAQTKKDPHYKSFKLSPQGDTLNIIDSKGLKQGKWVISVPETHGEPGYDEEGQYVDDKKEGVWRLYASSGDIVGVENYKFGGKDGTQQYFTYVGVLVREEEWHSVNPDAPYDTIPIYGLDNGNITGYKIVRVTQYSVPNGDWKYYDDLTGDLISTEHYDYGRLVNADGTTAAVQVPGGAALAKPTAPTVSDTSTTKKPEVKTPEVLEYEKKYSKKKREQMLHSGETGM